MRIQMDYPRSPISDAFDGNNHTIEPISLRRIEYNGREIYLLEYIDISLGSKRMLTLLERRGNEFIKVPLTNYLSRTFEQLLENIIANGEILSVTKLPGHIATRKNPIPIDDFLYPVQTATLTRIYHNLEDGRYYWNPECTNEITGGIESLGRINGNRIEGPNGRFYEIIDVRVKKGGQGFRKPPISPSITTSASLTRIYHNLEDDKYYWDSECTNEITGGIESLGRKIGNKIQGPNGRHYEIIDVRVKKGGNGFGKPPIPPTTHITTQTDSQNDAKVPHKTTRVVYYNEEDGQYYWDKECKSRIIGAPTSLGIRVGNKIRGKYLDYEIITIPKKEKKGTTYNVYFDGKNYYWDIDCEEQILGAPDSIGTLKPDKMQIEGRVASVIYRIVIIKKLYLRDGKYYLDEDCFFRMNDEEIIGRLSEGNGRITYQDSVYQVIDVEKVKEQNNGSGSKK